MRGEHPILAFNRGMISRLGMARVDLKRYPMSADVQTNWMPRVLGSAMLRPGLGYITGTRGNGTAKYIPFVFSATDTALLELTNATMRVIVDDEVVTRPSVTTAITNGTFSGSLAGWTDADEAGATSAWLGGDFMGLTGTGVNAAIRRQLVTCLNNNVAHALRIVIGRGPVNIRVGTAAGLSDYFEVELNTGIYSLAFTPTGDFYVDLLSRTTYRSVVTSIAVESSGPMEIDTPWLNADLTSIRFDQSGDVVFVACDGEQQRRIERFGATSWGVSLYQSQDGPYRPENTSTITMTAAALSGDTTITASRAYFKPTHTGALFSLTSVGQDITANFVATGSSSSIRVTGVDTDRVFTIVLSGLTATGNTVILERSFDDATWSAVSGKSWTADATESYDDTLDNQIVYYRLTCSVYAAGTTVARLTIATGSIRGVGMVTGYTSPTVLSVVALSPFGGTGPTETWSESLWSDYRGWPSAVSLYEGRLWWAGKDKWYGSITDDFANFNPEFEGDAGPIIRSIGSGPVDVINWLLPLQRLMAGTDSSIIAGRSSSFDEPLTPTNFNPKTSVTQGAAAVPAVKVDDTGVFVQRGGYRLLSMSPSIEQASNYAMDDLSQLVPNIGAPGILALAVQRQPDTRIHCVRSDGKAAVMIYDKTEDVKCWILVETDGLVEDVVVLPGSGGEEAVYYLVARNIGGSTMRYLERWAREDECVGGSTSKLQDSFVTYDGSNLDHLEGRNVVGWKDGIAYGPATVSAGVAAGFPSGATVGLSYEAKFKSTKLAFLANPGETALSAKKRTHSLSLVLADTHPLGIKYSARGFDDNEMDSLPLVEQGAEVNLAEVYDEYNYEAFALPGEWTVDSRLYLKAAAPYPCTLLAAIVGMNSNSTT